MNLVLERTGIGQRDRVNKMKGIILVLSIIVLLPALWGCEEDAYSPPGDGEAVEPGPGPGLQISDVELTPEQQDLLVLIENNIQNNNYGTAATDIVKLLEAHPGSDQVKRLYSDVLAMQSGITPSEFAIAIGARPIQVRNEDGEWVEKTSTISFVDSLVGLANVEDSDDYRVRFLNGRHALELRLQDKAISELPSREQADIGAMATIHATRLAYAAVGGEESAESLHSAQALQAALEEHLPEVDEELTETLRVVAQTSGAVQQHYPIREVDENPIRMSLARNAFANAMLDDNELSTEELVELVLFAPGL